MRESLKLLLTNAKNASKILAQIDEKTVNLALLEMAKKLSESKEQILVANQKDIENAKVNYPKKGIPLTMLARLELTESKIEGIVSSILDIVSLKSPVGELLSTNDRPSGIRIEKIRVPFGVIATIYESRPNVTVDVATLCLKTNNAIVLKGGSDAIESNKCLVSIMREAISSYLPKDSISLIEDSDHEVVEELLTAKEYVDLAVPRGGRNLIQMVVSKAKVPVIETGAGNCHLYVESHADFEKALPILVNAKVQKPSVCNAIENLLVDEAIAKEFLPLAKKELDSYQVELRGDEKTREIIDCKEATKDDFFTEYNDFILSIKVVQNDREAIDWINDHSTHHSEAIVTENMEIAETFLNAIDSACVYVNASTRFSDGGEFGFGAELGISTQKMHARGPMGLVEMTSYKYKIYGNGEVRK